MPFSLGLESAAQSYLQSKQVDQSVEESKTRQMEMHQRIRESMQREMSYALDNAFDRDTFDTRKHQLRRMDTMIEKDLELKSAQAGYYESSAAVNRERIAEVQSNVEFIKKKTGLSEEQIKSEIARRALWDEQIKEIQSRCNLNNEQMKLITEKIANVRQDTANKELWHELQELNRDSNHAFDKFLQEHENIAVVIGVLREFSRMFSGSVSGNGWSLSM